MAKLKPPRLEDIEAAVRLIRPHLPVTPLLRSEPISRALDAQVWMKYETATSIASFKIRGAMNAVAHARNRDKAGVVAASTGNHGQGVAYAARAAGMQAHIFLPCPANRVKAKMIDNFAGVVHEVGTDFDVAKAAAKDFAEQHNLLFIDDGEDPLVMAGAGTVGLEIARALTGLDYVLIPLGGGNLTAGCTIAIKALQPAARVISVQAEGSPAVTESFHAHALIERPIDTLADGLVTRVPPTLAIDVLWRLLDDAWLVGDDALLAGVHTLMESAHTLVEPAGAAALAGAWRHRSLLRGKRVVLVLTGANISRDLLCRALALPPLFAL